MSDREGCAAEVIGQKGAELSKGDARKGVRNGLRDSVAEAKATDLAMVTTPPHARRGRRGRRRCRGQAGRAG